MKIVKLLALVVLVLAIFGVSFWLTLGVDNRPDSPEEVRYNSLQELDDAIASYISNMSKWDEEEYEALKDDINLSISYLIKERKRDRTTDEYLQQLCFETEKKVMELLDEQLKNPNCNYNIAVNLGDGLKYFYKLRDSDDRDHMKALNDKYYAYCDVYNFLLNPTSSIKSPSLSNYIDDRWSSNAHDAYFDKMTDKVKENYKAYGKKMDDYGLNKINAFRDGLSNDSMNSKIADAKNKYYDSLLSAFNKYYDGAITDIDNAYTMVVNAQTIDEVKAIRSEMEKNINDVSTKLTNVKYNLGNNSSLNDRVYDCKYEYDNKKKSFFEFCEKRIQAIKDEIEEARRLAEQERRDSEYTNNDSSKMEEPSYDNSRNNSRNDRRNRNRRNRNK
jgi:hypothetical protein